MNDHQIRANKAKRLAARGNAPVYLFVDGKVISDVNALSWNLINKTYRQAKRLGARPSYWIIY